MGMVRLSAATRAGPDGPAGLVRVRHGATRRSARGLRAHPGRAHPPPREPAARPAIMYELDLGPDVEVRTAARAPRHARVLPATHRLANSTGPIGPRAPAAGPMVCSALPQLQPRLPVLAQRPHTASSMPHADLEKARSFVGRGFGWTLLLQRPGGDATYEGNPVVVKEIGAPVAARGGGGGGVATGVTPEPRRPHLHHARGEPWPTRPPGIHSEICEDRTAETSAFQTYASWLTLGHGPRPSRPAEPPSSAAAPRCHPRAGRPAPRPPAERRPGTARAARPQRRAAPAVPSRAVSSVPRSSGTTSSSTAPPPPWCSGPSSSPAAPTSRHARRLRHPRESGFVARPIGGVVMGHFGDKIGRKSMLVRRCC